MRLERLALATVLAAAACYSGGELAGGLAPANPNDTGPTIVWDLLAEPLPEVPFPNDAGTRPDISSPTGRRINVSTHATTCHEQKLRRIANTLDGFGTFAPIWIRFDGRIDVEDVYIKQNNDDPTDDVMFLVNIDPSSPTYGQPELLDFGHGRFPVTLEETDNYFKNDPRYCGTNLFFETYAEDRNGNGLLDAGEDTDDDGVLDVPNVWASLEPGALDPAAYDPCDFSPRTDGSDPYRDLVTFYELETETLIARHVFPLEQQSTYAVILTRNLTGKESGSPIRSPFSTINHLSQTPILRRLIEDPILDSLGIELGDIAFAWTFTTQTITDEIEAIRAGLYGQGKLRYLASGFPPRLTRVLQVDEPERTDNVYLLDAARLIDALRDPTVMDAVGLDEQTAGPLLDAYTAHVESIAFAEFESPAFIDNSDGVFLVDHLRGEAEVGRETVYLTCAIPKRDKGDGPPFRVVIYSHGYTSTRFELLGFAASLARHGLATCAIDAYGHGMPNSDFIVGLVMAILREKQLERTAEAVLASRSRDLNGDGATDSGGDFWSANIFHTRDVVRQSMIDYMRAVQVMRQFGKTTMPVDIDGDGALEIAGDFDGDGKHDIGGEQPYTIFGTSLGGIMSATVGPAEPMIQATAPSAGGGGLLDLSARTRQSGVVQAVYLPFLGPLVSSRVNPSTGRIEIVFDVLDINEEEEIRFALVPDPVGGELDEFAANDRIVVTNLDNGEQDSVVTRSDPPGLFRAQIAADYRDRIRIDLFRDGAQAPYRTIETFETADLEEVGFRGTIYRKGDTLRLLQEGFGHRRQSPDLRRLAAFGQLGVDPADPVNWAPLHANPIEMRPDGRVPTNVLVVNTTGDMNVPINSGISLARAARLFSVLQPDPIYGKSHDQLLIDTHVVEGLEHLRRFADDPCHADSRAVLFDIDEQSEGLDPTRGPHLTDVYRPAACDGSSGQPAYCATPCAPRPPLRSTVTHPWGMSGHRLLYVRNTGAHGFATPEPSRPFDYNTFEINQIGHYFATNGSELVDHTCMAGPTCPFYE